MKPMTDDYIRRQDALKGKKTGLFANISCFVSKPCVTVEFIESLEPADVRENVHGEWEDKIIKSNYEIEQWQSARCNKCGKWHTTPYSYYFDNFNFCPNCGAKMDEGARVMIWE